MKIYNAYAAVIGSGAAGLAAAVRLDSEGVKNVIVVTEGLDKGVSINTGSDKQTYYKTSLCGYANDSPKSMAETYVAAGGADGDLALVEAAYSTRAFFNLVDLGVPFPRDRFGQFAGYRTDHDPAKRATSCGPYTSREMCRALIREAKRRNIKIYEGLTVVALRTVDLSAKTNEDACDQATHGAPRKKIVGFVGVDSNGELFYVRAMHVVFAVGGPGGLYKTSVYPEVHTGAIGLALEVGALAKGLPESQFGLASFTDLAGRDVRAKDVTRPKEFRWNVSGTFMQVVPKFVSTSADGESDPKEFLREYFDDLGDLFGRVFLKGYQWPFDVRKAIDGSSFIDLCVFYETTIRGRRVFLDYRENPQDFKFELLPTEALDYLTQSGALEATPLERLCKMNPSAIDLYRDWGIDLASERLEIGVCAQHNNGGLDVDAWWRSTNVSGLYPIGEVAGTHGVARPGGSALNAGQVGAYRAAERIAYEYRQNPVEVPEAVCSLDEAMSDPAFDRKELIDDIKFVGNVVARALRMKKNDVDWRKERAELRERMSENAGVFRSMKKLASAASSARLQLRRMLWPTNVEVSCDDSFRLDTDDVESLRNVQLCVAQIAYLDSIMVSVSSRVGSRGSALTLVSKGKRISSKLPEDWSMQEENSEFRKKILCSFISAIDTSLAETVVTESFWRSAKPIPESDEWFENVWRDFREDVIYDDAQ